MTIRPNRGAIVVELNSDKLLELFEMRAVLEGLAARRGVERLDEDAEDRLFLAMRRLGRAKSVDGFILQHNGFHIAVCELGSIGGAQGRLATEAERLRASVEPYLRRYFAHHGGDETTTAEHRSCSNSAAPGAGGGRSGDARTHPVHRDGSGAILRVRD